MTNYLGSYVKFEEVFRDIESGDYDLNFLKNIEVFTNDIIKINAELSVQISNDQKLDIK